MQLSLRKPNVVEALAILRLAGCGCLMRPGARLPNAQQSVAQATTIGLALYNCLYMCTYIHNTCVYNCVHACMYYVHTCIQMYTTVNTAGPAIVP